MNRCWRRGGNGGEVERSGGNRWVAEVVSRRRVGLWRSGDTRIRPDGVFTALIADYLVFFVGYGAGPGDPGSLA